MFSRTRMPSAATALLGLATFFVTPVSAAEVVFRFGSITTDVPITIAHKSENSLSGTIGNGGCRLALSDNNGNITVGRE